MDKTQKDLLYRCKNDIIKNYIGNNGFKLKHTDYLQLADEIYDKTKISLSISTLKRFFSDDLNSLPKISTLNAFANYLGFDNWKEYCKKNASDKINQNPSDYVRRKSFMRFLFIPFGFAIIIGLYFVIIKIPSHSKNDFSTVEFYYTDYDSTKIPSTITFQIHHEE